MQGFLLGLSSGAVCAAYCAPVLVPYLLGEGRDVRRSALALTQFLGGRLLVYLAFAVLAQGLHAALPQEAARRDLLLGSVYLVLSGLLLHYSFFASRPGCPPAGIRTGDRPGRRRALFPFAAGLATGLGLCPPLLLAIATAAAQANLWQSLLFFLSFFAGTSVFLLPAPLLGLLRGFPPLSVIGKMAAGLIGAYYLYSGAILLAGGFLR